MAHPGAGYWAMPQVVSTLAAPLAELIRAADRGALYAVLDACDEPRVPAKVGEIRPERAASLYRGPAAEDLAAIAPYLVRADAEFVEWIAGTLWTDPWGVFAVTDAGFDTLRTHLRKFLLVDAPDGDHWYFRFYDPRVLSRFLPTCDAAQLTDFFGPVTAYGWTDHETYGVTLARQVWADTSAPARPRVTFRSS